MTGKQWLIYGLVVGGLGAAAFGIGSYAMDRMNLRLEGVVSQLEDTVHDAARVVTNTPTPDDVAALEAMLNETAAKAAARNGATTVTVSDDDDMLGWFQFFDENGRGLSQGCGGFAVSREGSTFTVATSEMAYDQLCAGVRPTHLWVRSESPSLNFVKYPAKPTGVTNGFRTFSVDMPEIADGVFIPPHSSLYSL